MPPTDIPTRTNINSSDHIADRRDDGSLSHEPQLRSFVIVRARWRVRAADDHTMDLACSASPGIDCAAEGMHLSRQGLRRGWNIRAVDHCGRAA